MYVAYVLAASSLWWRRSWMFLTYRTSPINVIIPDITLSRLLFRRTFGLDDMEEPIAVPPLEWRNQPFYILM